MSIPTDPYNTPSRRPFDEGDVLEPLTEGNAPSEPGEIEIDYSVFTDDDAAPSEPTYAASAQEPAAGEDAVPGASSPASSASVPVESTGTDAERAAGLRTSIFDSQELSAASSPASAPSGRTAIAASVGLGGVTAPEEAPEQPTEEPNEALAAGFMTGESSEDAAERRERWANEPADLLEDPTPELPKKRGWTHTWTLLVTLVLIPAAWYLISDGHVRMDVAFTNSTTNIAGAMEILGGVVVAGVAWFLARKSSLGLTVVGALIAAWGAVAALLPKMIDTEVLSPLYEEIHSINPFMGNLAHHLRIDSLTGTLFAFGALVFLSGRLSHRARRQGEAFGSATTYHELTNTQESTSAAE